jgi:hypothetical protein
MAEGADGRPAVQRAVTRTGFDASTLHRHCRRSQTESVR